MESRYPLFKHGRILKKEALEVLRDYPVDMLNIRYKEYTDGIISGLNIRSDNERKCLILKKGMVKFQGFVYLINKESEIPYIHSDKKEVLKLVFSKDRSETDWDICRIEAVLSTEEEIKDNEILICSFILKSGFMLRDEYRDFADMGTEYDTINLIEAPWSGYEESSLSIEVLRRYAKEYLATKQCDDTDRNFCYTVLNSREAIPRLIIENYIAYKENLSEIKKLGNREIYNKLSGIMKKARNTDTDKRLNINPKKILVD